MADNVPLKENVIVTIILNNHLSCIILHVTLFQSSYKTIHYPKTFSYVIFVIWKTKRNVTHSNWNILNVKLEIQSKELHKDMYKIQICFWSFNFLHLGFWWTDIDGGLQYLISSIMTMFFYTAISAFTVIYYLYKSIL